MRYIAGSRRFMLGEAMSIRARTTCSPSAYLPARISRSSFRFSSTVREAVGAVFAGLDQGAAHDAHLVGGEAVDVGMAAPHQLLRKLVEEVEVVRRGGTRWASTRSPATHRVADRIDVLGLLLGRVGVVEAQVAGAAVLVGQAEVEADRLGVTVVQVAVGLRGKARADLRRVERGVLAESAEAGLPLQAAAAYLPAIRSASTIWRMKFE